MVIGVSMKSIFNNRLPIRGTRGWNWFNRAVQKKKEYDLNKGKQIIPLARDEKLVKEKRKKAFLEISIDEKPIGRLVFELANDLLPKTCENFTKLCSFPKEEGGYTNSKFHVLRKGIHLVGGDTTLSNGRGGYSAFDERFFEDEGFYLDHKERGVLSMANCGKDKNASQFLITLSPQQHLDGNNVAFGHLVEGSEVLEAIEKIFTVKGKPVSSIKIQSAGEI